MLDEMTFRDAHHLDRAPGLGTVTAGSDTSPSARTAPSNHPTAPPLPPKQADGDRRRLGNGRRQAGFLGLVCVLLLTAFGVPAVGHAGTFNYSGTIDTNSPSYQRTGGSGSGASCAILGPTRFYQAQPFTVDVSGSYILKNESNTFAPFDSGDSYFALYTGTFTPGSPMTNCTAVNDDESPADIKSKIIANLVTGTLYILVTTPFGNSTGNFANSLRYAR